VAAASFRASLAANVLTHFTREDDAGAAEGRLDAELARLRDVVGQARPTSLVLLNESVSGTNERDAAEIAHGVVTALADAGASVWFVTHLFELARRLQTEADRPILFLRAERGIGGDRPYRVTPAPPLETSFGMDLYRRLRTPR
jgi:DNA mismatch repair ATPase MutS